jgi:hypothetical protein
MSIVQCWGKVKGGDVRKLSIYTPPPRAGVIKALRYGSQDLKKMVEKTLTTEHLGLIHITTRAPKSSQSSLAYAPLRWICCYSICEK